LSQLRLKQKSCQPSSYLLSLQRPKTGTCPAVISLTLTQCYEVIRIDTLCSFFPLLSTSSTSFYLVLSCAATHSFLCCFFSVFLLLGLQRGDVGRAPFWSILSPDVLSSVFTPFVFGYAQFSGVRVGFRPMHYILHILGTWPFLSSASYE
jgi:hypothetical protein